MTPIEKGKERLTTLRRFQYSGYALIPGIIAAMNAKDKIVKIVTDFSFSEDLFSLLQVLLIVFAITLIYRFVSTTGHEVQFLQEFLSFAPRIRSQSYTIILLIATLLGILVYFYDNIIIFSGIFAVLNLSTVWSDWTARLHIKESISESRKKKGLTKEELQCIDAIDKYFFQRPQQARIVTILFFSLVSVILGVVGTLWQSSEAIYFLYAAYAMIILNIIISEFIISLWRKERDKVFYQSKESVGR
ncbi:MAG TPA: hypothetical protein VIL52_09535 [Bacteroidota bacterium]